MVNGNMHNCMICLRAVSMNQTSIHLLIYVLGLLPFASPEIYEFCAGNELFRFPRKECPGGVFFKYPIQLTEPQSCIKHSLTVYPSCDSSSIVKNQHSAYYQKSPKASQSILVKILQPFVNLTVPRRRRHSGMACRRARAICQRKRHNPSRGRRKRSHSFLHTKEGASGIEFNTTVRHHLLKREAKDTRDTDAKLQERILETMNLLNELQFGSESGVPKPNSMSFQLLFRTVEIFNEITPAIIVEDEVVNSILTMFLRKYADMELPSYSGKLSVDASVTDDVFRSVMESLRECSSRARDPAQKFEFLTTPKTCPPVITHVVHKVKRPETGSRRIQYELGKFMPIERKYMPEKEDFILGALCKIFDTVYSYCFSSVFSYQTSTNLNSYFTIIYNIFSSSATISDFLTENYQGTAMYASRIEHANLTVLMTNLDYMSEAVHLLSRFKSFLRKPVVFDTKWERPRRDEHHFMKMMGLTSSTSESPIFRNRNKRSATRRGNLKDYEIWDGKAYCLQLDNLDLQPGLSNTKPSIKGLCELKLD